MSAITDNLQAVKQRIVRAAQASGRNAESVRLLAVSKTFGTDAVRAAFEAGQHAFGENYVQEAIEKITTLDALRTSLEWHMIGPIQSNKTRQIAEYFDWVHSVDRLKIAERLSAQRPAELPPLQICLQVNISNEASKSGVLPHEVATLAHAIRQLPRLQLRGLMAIPEPVTNPSQQRQPFAALHKLLEDLNQQNLQPSTPLNTSLDTLSMGMSDDLEAAIAEGATIVRVGSAIFGKRL